MFCLEDGKCAKCLRTTHINCSKVFQRAPLETVMKNAGFIHSFKVTKKMEVPVWTVCTEVTEMATGCSKHKLDMIARWKFQLPAHTLLYEIKQKNRKYQFWKNNINLRFQTGEVRNMEKQMKKSAN